MAKPVQQASPASSRLAEPLLGNRLPVHASANGTAAADSSPASSCPSSFKAGKPRKTRDFIGVEQSTSSAREAQPDVDPRLLDDTDVEIFAKVAALVYGHIQEGLTAGARAEPLDDQFHEAHFLRRSCCSCRCRRRAKKQVVSSEDVRKFINDIATSLFFCKQVIVVGAVYIERLLSQRVSAEACFLLTEHNWRSLVVVAILVASKVWEDVHPWNADFEECLLEVAGMRLAPGALYRMESIFMERLDWKVFVSGEDYAAYFFALLENRQLPTISSSVKARTYTESFASRKPTFAIEPIFEDEMFVPGRGSRRSSQRHSLSLATTPWARKDLIATWKESLLDGGDAGALTTCAMNEVWRLDATNPYVGALRHAPPAPPPSKHIRQSEGLMWAQTLATRTSDVLSAHKSRQDSSATISGATGAQMAAELQRLLKNKGGGPAATSWGTAPTTTFDLFGGGPVAASRGATPTTTFDLFGGGGDLEQALPSDGKS